MTIPRKAHVKRVYQILSDPITGEDVLSTDRFVDLVRLDELPVNFQSTNDGRLGQIIRYRLRWNDDPSNPDQNIDASNADAQFENANAKRKTEKRKIKDPDVKTSDVENDFYVWIVDKMKVLMPQGKDTGAQGQIVQFVFDNMALFNDPDGKPGDRKTSVVKIVNNDLGGLKMKNDDGSPVIVSWDTYKQALQDGKTDATDPLFLSMEFTDRFKIIFGADATTGGEGQKVVTVLTGNREIENLFEAGDPNVTDVNGDSALVRLDPLQAIVNVGSNIIAVEFAAGLT